MKTHILLPIIGLLFLACQISYSNESAESRLKQKSTNPQHKIRTNKDSLRISYIANMGVLIESGLKTVIIDALHEPYKPDYLSPSREVVDNLIQGTYQDFTGIEVALFTHQHKDHFSAKYSKRFLEENPDGILVSPAQITDLVLKEAVSNQSKIEHQLRTVPYDGEIHQINESDIQIEAIRCDHGNPARHRAIENMAYLITINGYTILHIGDTEWAAAKAVFEKLKLKERNLDIAVLPYWMLLGNSSRDLVESYLAPKRLIATHLPPYFSKQEEEDLNKRFSGIKLFTQVGDQMNLTLE